MWKNSPKIFQGQKQRSLGASRAVTLFFAGITLVLGLLALATEISADTSVRNDISVSANSGGNHADGQDGKDGENGEDGRDGKDGKDGEDGTVILGNSKSSVSIETIIDGKVVESYQETVENGEDPVVEHRVYEDGNSRVETQVEMSAGENGGSGSQSAELPDDSEVTEEEAPSQSNTETAVLEGSDITSSTSITSNASSTDDSEAEQGGMFTAIQSFVSSIVAYVFSIFA